MPTKPRVEFNNFNYEDMTDKDIKFPNNPHWMNKPGRWQGEKEYDLCEGKIRPICDLCHGTVCPPGNIHCCEPEVTSNSEQRKSKSCRIF